MKKITICIAALLLTSCTAVRYKSGDTSLTVIDFSPGEDRLEATANIDGKGEITVGRLQGSSVDAITAAAALVPTTP